MGAPLAGRELAARAPARWPKLLAWAGTAVGGAAAVAALWWTAGASAAPATSPSMRLGDPSPNQDRAVAFGLLLDTPASDAVVREAIEIADRLRHRYGIDTGNPQADREEATRRVREEVLAHLSFTPAEMEAVARSLGYSLDPAACRNFCDNVRRLAEVELRKRALREFADGAAPPAP